MLPSLPANSTAEAKPPPPPRPPLRCPRCESTNTKFCYYNNYSLSQPRHFCKSCRRYWTHGGALRNVPVGGGSRKSKKHRSSSSSGPALKLFQHPPPPLMMVDFPVSNSNLISPFGELRNLTPPAGSSLPNFLGLNFSYNNNSNAEEAGGLLTTSSSIEPLNQLELQWKLQQQRMAVLYGHLPCNSEPAVTNTPTAQIMEEKPQPIFFQNLEVTNPNTPTLEVGNGNGMHQWFFDSSYGGAAAGTSAGENDGNPTRLNSAGYVLDKDGVIKFQPYSELLAIKKV